MTKLHRNRVDFGIFSLILAFLGLWACPTLVQGQSEVLIEQLDGSKVAGRLMRWEQDSIVLEQDGRVASMDLRLLRTVSFENANNDPSGERASAIRIELRDGSSLFAKDVEGSQDRWTLNQALGIEQLPAGVIHAIQFRNLSSKEQASFDEWKQEKMILDSLIVSRADGIVDRIQGLIKGVTRETIPFDLEGQNIDAPRNKVAAVLFARPPMERLGLTARLQLVDRSEWLATEILWNAKGAELTWKNALGVSGSVPSSQIATIDLTKLNVRWLAELDAIERKVALRVATKSQFASRDRLFGPQFSGSSTTAHVERDLVFPSPGEISFRVPEGVASFATKIRRVTDGDAMHELTAEIFHADEPVFQSKVPEDGSAIDVQISVQPNRRLRLVIRSSSPLAAGSSVHWSQPRFER